jgi:hypothetical protein
MAAAIEQQATVTHAIAAIRTGGVQVLHSATELAVLVEQLKSKVARFTV